MLGGSNTGGVIAPPFANGKEAVAYTTLLLSLLALPFVLAAFDVPAREDVYRTAHQHGGNYERVHRQVFEETGPLDILFLGSSMMWAALDAPAVQRALHEHLGREVNVQMIGLNWRSEEKYYLILRDLLELRRVGLIVMTTPLHSLHSIGSDAFRWSSRRDVELGLTAGLGAVERGRFLAAHVLGAPRHLLSLVRPNRPAELEDEENRGSALLELGWRRQAFTPLELDAPRLSLAALAASDAHIEGRPNPFQVHFFRKICEVASSSGSALALVTPPSWHDRANERATHLADWSQLAGRPLPILAPPPRRLFSGLEEDQIEQLYYDSFHFNANGSRYFTASVLPALLEVFDRHGR